MAVRVTTIPFSGGHDTSIDANLAGLGRFRRVVNGRLDADGRIVSRPGYTALATTTYGSGSHVCYDLFELDGRLCSLGDRRSLGHPSDVFEYVPGAAAAWKPTSVATTTDTPRLPRGTRLREVLRPPNQEGGVSAFDVAAIAGFLLLVYNDDASPPLGSAIVALAETGQPLLIQEADGTNIRGQLKAVGLTTRFWMLGFSSDTTEINGRDIDPATDEVFAASATTLLSDAAGFAAYAAEKVAGSDELVVAAVTADSELIVRRFDDDGAVITPSSSQYATVSSVAGQYIAVEADSSSDTITVAVVNDETLELYSWTLSTGAQIGSPPYTPTEVASETCANVALARVNSTTVAVLATVTSMGTPAQPRVMRWNHVVSSGAFGDDSPLLGMRLATAAVRMSGTGTFVFGAVNEDADGSPNLLIEHGSGGDVLSIVAAKDLGFAAPPLEGLPRLAIDSSRDPARYYWAHGVQGADGASLPVVAELALTDPGRRQVARVGRGAVIAGACPCWYDGTQLVELGFSERPSIVSLTSSNGSGELEPGAPYTYRVVRNWFDAQGRLHRSAVSEPLEVTTGADHDTVTAIVSGAHSVRHSRGSAPLGSVVTDELYRTRAIVTREPAAVTGNRSIDPPSGSLDGQVITIFTTTAVFGATATVTFAATDDTLTEVLAAINAQAGGNYEATEFAGALRITSALDGAASYIQVNRASGTDVLDILGFVEGQNAYGTTDIERGEVFHLTASQSTTVGGDCGEQVTFVDVRDDDTDDDGIASQAVLYVQLESPLSDHAPLPADYIWAGTERLIVAGHPQRELWTASKLLEVGFAPAFAEQGQTGFSGEVPESIEAVIAEEHSHVLLTRRALWQVDGKGPELNGKGAFQRARRVFADGGLVADGWRSLLATSRGTWMQLGPDKLYLMQPGGAPVWAGFPIRELLLEYPVIVAATLTSGGQVAAFALQNEAGDEGRIALFDLRAGAWFVDELDAAPVALADYQGRLAWADSDGTVYLQDESAGSGTFVPLTVETGFATQFGVAGQGSVPTILLVGRLLGECTLELSADYDDGEGPVSLGSVALTAANGYTAGQTVREQFDLAVEDTSQFALTIEVTGASNSAGLALVALDVHTERDPGPALLGNHYRR